METVFLGGAGGNKYAYDGVVMALEDAGVTRTLRAFYGSSAGAIYAFALAARRPAKFIVALSAQSPDGAFTQYKPFLRVVQEASIFNPDNLVTWTRQVVQAVTGDGAITFGQMHDRYGSTLVIFGTNTDTRGLEAFGPDTTPDMPVVDALVISTRVPYLYPMCKYKGRTYVDGDIMYWAALVHVMMRDPHTLSVRINNADLPLIGVVANIMRETRADVNINIPSDSQSHIFVRTPAEKKALADRGYIATMKWLRASAVND